MKEALKRIRVGALFACVTSVVIQTVRISLRAVKRNRDPKWTEVCGGAKVVMLSSALGAGAGLIGLGAVGGVLSAMTSEVILPNASKDDKSFKDKIDTTIDKVEEWIGFF